MEQIIYRILIYTIMFSLSIFLFSLSFYLPKRNTIRDKELSLKEYEVNINANIKEDTFRILDKVIEECFSEYTILNIEYRSDVNFADAELEKIITQEVCHKVIERISPALLSKISLLYNINNFDTILSERVYLFTMDYIIKKNSIIEKEER